MILKRVLIGMVMLLGLLPLALQAGASPMPSSELREMHQRLLADPSNLDRLYEYAQFAINEGNFESAIGAMEGMLVISKNQPRILLELGVLYQRLGVARTANLYLEQAQQLSPEGSKISTLAQSYMVDVETEPSRHMLIGALRVGVRYQDNPTFSPEVANIRSGGFSVPLPELRKVASDSNAMFSAYLGHRYSMTEHTSLATDLALYGTAYADNIQLNSAVIDLSTGPRFSSPQNAEGQYSLRPHLLVRASSLNGEQLEQTVGLGLDFRKTFGADTLVKARYQFRDVEFKDVADGGTAAQRSGNEHSLDLRYRSELFRGHLIEVGLFGRKRGAEREYFELEQVDITLRYGMKFHNFMLPDAGSMTLTPYIIRRFLDYGAADPDIDSRVARSDREWRLGLNYQLPLVKSWAMVLDYEHLEADSNIINYDVRNNLYMVSLQMGF